MLLRLCHLIGVVALSAACGDVPNSSGGTGGQAGAAGSSGVSGGSGSVAAGGAPGTGGTSAGCTAMPPYYCVSDWCGGDVVFPPTCSSGVWTCPDGTVPPSECPDDACFHPPVIWCCDALGNQSAPTCPNQAAEVCPPDTYMSWGFCPPAGTFSCGELGLSCKLGQEYCRRVTNKASTCEVLPAACGSAPDCACLAPVAPCDCVDAGLDALTLFCSA